MDGLAATVVKCSSVRGVKHRINLGCRARPVRSSFLGVRPASSLGPWDRRTSEGVASPHGKAFETMPGGSPNLAPHPSRCLHHHARCRHWCSLCVKPDKDADTDGSGHAAVPLPGFAHGPRSIHREAEAFRKTGMPCGKQCNQREPTPGRSDAGALR
jgi:hypothetical protein